MSIDDEIRKLVDRGDLVEFDPMDKPSIYRAVFLLPDVNSQIVGPWEAGSYDEKEMPLVRRFIEHFMFGNIVTVSFQRSPKAGFRRLEDRANLVWEMRILDPKPGNRLFGFFARADVFVGTQLVPRDDLNFDEEIRTAKQIWKSLLPDEDPLLADGINAYISENAFKICK